MSKKEIKVTGIHPAGDAHRVLTIEGGDQANYQRQPCKNCPWRKDATGEFPPESFRHSARTAYDMSRHSFGCHQAGVEKPKTCAGFLLRGSDHNLSARLGRMKGLISDDVSDGGHELHENYRSMAIANGVDPQDPVLTPCRD